MKNLPEKIYLQVDADGETPEDFNELKGVTWCAERINKTDIEYYRSLTLREILEKQGSQVELHRRLKE